MENEELTLDERREMQSDKLLKMFRLCVHEARRAQDRRREQNWRNHSIINGHYDAVEQRDTNSRDIKANQKKKRRVRLQTASLAYDQFKAKMRQSLMNFDQWLAVVDENQRPDAIITDTVAKRLLERSLERAKIKVHFADAIGLGAVESRACIKVCGRWDIDKKYVANKNELRVQKKKRWNLSLKVVPFENLLQDPHDQTHPLYLIEEYLTDKRNLWELADDEPKPDKPFKKDAVKELKSYTRPEGIEEEQQEKRGNADFAQRNSFRHPILVQHFWGTILDEDGLPMEWYKEDGSEVYLENVFFTVANDKVLLTEPLSNPRWSQTVPYIYTNLMRRDNVTYTKAYLDDGIEASLLQDEMFNMLARGAKKTAMNVNLAKLSAFAKPEQLSDGIKEGMTLFINDSVQDPRLALASARTGEVPADGFQMYQEIKRVVADNFKTNQIDLSGNLPSKQVRATELVQSQQSISSLHDSTAADIEETFVEPLAEECWMELLQHSQHIPDEDLEYAFEGHPLGPDALEVFKDLSPAERFEEGAQKFRFRGKGVRELANNVKKSQALSQLFAIIGSNPLVQQEILDGGYSIGKMFGQVVKGSGIDAEEIRMDEDEIKIRRKVQEVIQAAMALGQAGVLPTGGGQNGAVQQGSMNPAQNSPDNGVSGEMVAGNGAGQV